MRNPIFRLYQMQETFAMADRNLVDDVVLN